VDQSFFLSFFLFFKCYGLSTYVYSWIMLTLGALCMMSLHTSIVRVKCLHTYKDYHLQQNEWIGTRDARNIVYGLDQSVHSLCLDIVYRLSSIYNAYYRVLDLFWKLSRGGRVHWLWFHGVWTCSWSLWKALLRRKGALALVSWCLDLRCKSSWILNDFFTEN